MIMFYRHFTSNLEKMGIWLCVLLSWYEMIHIMKEDFVHIVQPCVSIADVIISKAIGTLIVPWVKLLSSSSCMLILYTHIE